VTERLEDRTITQFSGDPKTTDIFLVKNQLDALFSMYFFIYFTSAHVSSNTVLIIRRIELY